MNTLLVGGACSVAEAIAAIAGALSSGRNRFVWKWATGARRKPPAWASRYGLTLTLSSCGLSALNGLRNSFPWSGSPQQKNCNWNRAPCPDGRTPQRTFNSSGAVATASQTSAAFLQFALQGTSAF